MNEPTAGRLDNLRRIDRDKINLNVKTGCWEWTGHIDPAGYGQVKRGGRVQGAHRYLYEQLVGPIGRNAQQLDHLCRVRRCVNPSHLEPVAAIQNSRRGLAAISGELPDDLYKAVLRLVERAYKRGLLDGIRQAGGGSP